MGGHSGGARYDRAHWQIRRICTGDEPGGDCGHRARSSGTWTDSKTRGIGRVRGEKWCPPRERCDGAGGTLCETQVSGHSAYSSGAQHGFVFWTPFYHALWRMAGRRNFHGNRKPAGITFVAGRNRRGSGSVAGRKKWTK